MDDLKRKIANLRTCYLREFKKVMDAKKYGGIYEPSLWYYKWVLIYDTPNTTIIICKLGRLRNCVFFPIHLIESRRKFIFRFTELNIIFISPIIVYFRGLRL